MVVKLKGVYSVPNITSDCKMVFRVSGEVALCCVVVVGWLVGSIIKWWAGQGSLVGTAVACCRWHYLLLLLWLQPVWVTFLCAFVLCVGLAAALASLSSTGLSNNGSGGSSNSAGTPPSCTSSAAGTLSHPPHPPPPLRPNSTTTTYDTATPTACLHLILTCHLLAVPLIAALSAALMLSGKQKTAKEDHWQDALGLVLDAFDRQLV